MKIAPCLNPRCGWLGMRPTGAPAPERCPRCGGPLMPPDYRRRVEAERSIGGAR